MRVLQPLIGSRILRLREQRAMIDADLAEAYSVPTKPLVQAVKRNLVRQERTAGRLTSPRDSALQGAALTSSLLVTSTSIL